jgi:raffinose/stachyose/melibiose transport system permease protein
VSNLVQRRARIGRTTRSVVVLAIALVAAIPLYYVLISSFKTSVDMLQRPLGLPRTWTLENYAGAFEDGSMAQAFGNSLFVTVLGVVIQVVIGSLAAYGVILSKTWLTASVGALLAVAFAIPGQATLVPQYALFARAGLTDSLTGLALLYTTGAIFCYFLIVAYMRSLPRELFEAARVDGAGAFRVYRSIVLPLTRPILTTVIVFQTMGVWNDFLLPNVYLASPEKRTVPLQVYAAMGQFSTNWPLFMAITVLALLPVLVLFVVAQRWIVSGLVAGAVKG